MPAPAADDPLLGKLIHDRFELTKFLGAGGMGVVYQAKHLNSQGQLWREVAVKMIRPDQLNNDPEKSRAAVDAFLHEINLAMRLENEHLVTMYDAGETPDGVIYCVMKLINGPTLRQILSERPLLPLPAVLEITRQICAALEAAHGASPPVVHRDLKPPNVFVERWPDAIAVRVGDFGISKELAEGVTAMETRPLVGTLAYMAPEQFTGEAVGRGTDLYALGVMLYEMVRGQRPFGGAPTQLMHQHTTVAPPPLPETLPASLRSLVERLLEKRREDRPRSAREVRLELEDIARAPAIALALPSTVAPEPSPATSATAATAVTATAPAAVTATAPARSPAPLPLRHPDRTAATTPTVATAPRPTTAPVSADTAITATGRPAEMVPAPATVRTTSPMVVRFPAWRWQVPLAVIAVLVIGVALERGGIIDLVPAAPTPAASVATPTVAAQQPTRAPVPSGEARSISRQALGEVMSGDVARARQIVTDGAQRYPEELRRLADELTRGVLILFQYEGMSGGQPEARRPEPIWDLDATALGRNQNYRFAMAPSARCHLYAFQIDSRPAVTMIFPNPSLATQPNPVPGTAVAWIPGAGFSDGPWLRLDDSAGTERVYFVAINAPLRDPAGLANEFLTAAERTRARLRDDLGSLVVSEGEASPTGCFAGGSPLQEFHFEHQ
jgi:serine/threonine-protein kinase